LRVQRYYFFSNYQNFYGKIYKKPQNFRIYFAIQSICSTFAAIYTYLILMKQTKTSGRKATSLSEELVKTITEGIQEKKGSDIVVADLTKIEGTICKYFIICQGNSPTQVEAIAESVGDFARERLKEKPTHVVGLENAQWVAMDYTDVLVHIFLPDVREYYDLEHLWDDAKLTHIPNLD